MSSRPVQACRIVGVAVGSLLSVVVVAGCGAGTDPSPTGHATAIRVVRPTVPVTLVAHPVADLAAPLQDAAAAPWRGGALLVGGLTAADVSTAAIELARPSGAAGAGTLPPEPSRGTKWASHGVLCLQFVTDWALLFARGPG